ncbi:hypothetical protein [Dokdonella immobilis]|uniref:Uncharacterized protein n=1 Tax=Dokdonella immobilis TaxID=578942 RepID=A0A1I4X6Y6_9GAMM|nr:hypothetical protein [Dokdonella immobilis]SFN21778.1 hypothetical protein SAMN05216289_10851 [Dokdonella immobilis]
MKRTKGLSRFLHAATACCSLVFSTSAHADPDEIYGDDFEGFDPPPCDMAIPTQPGDLKDYAKAMDLCSVYAPGAQTSGVVSAVLSRVDGTGSPAASSYAVRPRFGTGTLPTFGDSTVVLSTGAAAGQGDTAPSFVAFEPGFNHAISSALPGDWLAANGNAIPRPPNCPAVPVNLAHDPVMLTLNVRVPGNAHSFSVDVNYFGADFPEWVCSPLNDVFVALLDSTYAGSPANPADRNLAASTEPGSGGLPLGAYLAYANSGLFRQCINGNMGCESGGVAAQINTCTSTAGLVSTGMDIAHPGACDSNSLAGGGTDWLVIRGNVVPGETITLRFGLWDSGDGFSDSLVLLDHFRWSPLTVSPGMRLP